MHIYVLLTYILLNYMYTCVRHTNVQYTITLQCMTSTFLKSALSAKNPTDDTTQPNSPMEA